MKHVSNTSLELKKGAWTAQEDMLLKNCIKKYGEGKWHLVPLKAVIKPQPHTLSKPLSWFKGDNKNAETHDDGNIIRLSNDGVGNKYNMSSELISSPVVLDDTINEFLKELFDEEEKAIDSEIGWSFDGSQIEKKALNVTEDNENSLFDFSSDEFMWNLLNS
ncbi:hypothetical protein Ccrd_018932 [Cynara cardunculus var. scolymus]|uniref:Uncharacterized protein n=1 Tax=Cynara cardunculus var. scolymus TaxID=59895 RepID=A0A118K1G9_CYNCS|nr:hypothetical protein Ccrd_018932 [Cynara cardunculus var. scolymus]